PRNAAPAPCTRAPRRRPRCPRAGWPPRTTGDRRGPRAECRSAGVRAARGPARSSWPRARGCGSCDHRAERARLHRGHDVVVLAAIDGAEADAVARTEQDRLGRAGIVEPERGAAEDPVAAGAFHRVDADLDAPDADATGGNFGAWRLQARQPDG